MVYFCQTQTNVRTIWQISANYQTNVSTIWQNSFGNQNKCEHNLVKIIVQSFAWNIGK